MERLLYFIRKCIKGNLRFCRDYCGNCPYFERCKNDRVLD